MQNDPEQKVVPIRPQPHPKLHPRLEEIRRLLDETEPAPPPEEDQSNSKVIKDRGAFRKRFGPGFSWKSERHREALIELIEEKQLTDSEVRLFHYTGNLTRHPFGVSLSANRWVALWGVIPLAYMLALFAALVGVAVTSSNVTLERGLRMLGALCLAATFCYAIYLAYIKPWRVQRRIMRRK